MEIKEWSPARDVFKLGHSIMAKKKFYTSIIMLSSPVDLILSVIDIFNDIWQFR